MPDDATLCCYCGKRLVPAARKKRQSCNGTGCAYQRPGEKTWTAQIVTGYRPLPPFDPENPKNKKQRIPIKKRKGGFKTKSAALAYCVQMQEDAKKVRIKQRTLQEVYDIWEPWYLPRVGPGTMAGYRAAFKHFADLNDRFVDQIRAGDLQACMDKCSAGKRTHQQMKVVAGLLWEYCTDNGLAPRKITENLCTGKGKSKKREALTEKEVEVIKKHLQDEAPYSEYVYALCFLGYRPGELLELKKDQLHKEKKILYIEEGKKTEAGRDRIVTIPPQIRSILENRAKVEGTDLLFPMYMYDRKDPPNFLGFKQMTDAYFRESIFKPMMKRLGIAEGKVPYGTRHTYANKLKKVKGSDVDKASLMGHSDYTFTQTRYQSSELEDKNRITSAMK